MTHSLIRRVRRQSPLEREPSGMCYWLIVEWIFHLSTVRPKLSTELQCQTIIILSLKMRVYLSDVCLMDLGIWDQTCQNSTMHTHTHTHTKASVSTHINNFWSHKYRCFYDYNVYNNVYHIDRVLFNMVVDIELHCNSNVTSYWFIRVVLYRKGHKVAVCAKVGEQRSKFPSKRLI